MTKIEKYGTIFKNIEKYLSLNDMILLIHRWVTKVVEINVLIIHLTLIKYNLVFKHIYVYKVQRVQKSKSAKERA